MSDKPSIYAHCPAGCLWETVHKSDLVDGTFKPLKASKADGASNVNTTIGHLNLGMIFSNVTGMDTDITVQDGKVKNAAQSDNSTKATKDSDGNAINTTYSKKAEAKYVSVNIGNIQIYDGTNYIDLDLSSRMPTGKTWSDVIGVSGNMQVSYNGLFTSGVVANDIVSFQGLFGNQSFDVDEHYLYETLDISKPIVINSSNLLSSKWGLFFGYVKIMGTGKLRFWGFHFRELTAGTSYNAVSAYLKNLCLFFA